MKAIPTVYRGTQFRSRIEARWAEFFDMIGVVWQYEPEGYATAAGNYLPDFWLPRVYSRGKAGGAFFEVKATSPTSREQDKAFALAAGSGRPVIVPTRSPHQQNPEWLYEYRYDKDHIQQFDEGLEFARCPNCGQADIGFYAGDEPRCPCGKATFSPTERILETARFHFPNLGRWEAAA